MGRFIYAMNVSLDLRIEQVPGDGGAGEWLRIGEALHHESNERTRGLAGIVQGRITYEIMEENLPAVLHDMSAPKVVREYAGLWVAMPKVLVSRSRSSADHHTRVVGGDDAIGELATLRADTDGLIAVGGATLATQLLAAGLLDEMLLTVHPTVLGHGRALFDDYDRPIDVELLERTTFEHGVSMEHYAIRPENEARA